MSRKPFSRPIDILAAAAADDQVHHVDNHDEDQSGSESNKLSGSDPDSMVIPKPTEVHSPRSKSSRKRSLPKHRLVNELESPNKNARVDKSGSAINRVWSEQDEIAILQGLIDYKLSKGDDPFNDMNAFYEYVQDLISVQVSKKQLTDKVRRLKNKYLGNVERGDVENVLVKAHDVKLFEISEVIWGSGETVRVTKDKDDGNVVENGKVDDEERGNGKVDVAENGVEVGDMGGENVVENGVNGKGVDDKEVEGKDFKEMYPYLSRAYESDVSCSMLMKNFMMDNIRTVGSVELRQMDKKWKSLYAEQLKLYVKRLDLEKGNAQLALDQLEASDP